VLIILTICHVLNGTCLEKQLPVPDAPANPAYCLRQAQPTIANFMALFPNYRVARTRCMSEEQAERLEKKA
jgi:hypothetical protein